LFQGNGEVFVFGTGIVKNFTQKQKARMEFKINGLVTKRSNLVSFVVPNCHHELLVPGKLNHFI